MTITKNGVNLVNDEGIRDTLVDLHNYAAMAVMLMDEWNEMEWNGMEWNRMEWNGMKWNGMKWNASECVAMERERMRGDGIEKDLKIRIYT
jgi:hypothetical protein